MIVAGGVADRPDWRNERSYDYTARLTHRGWAWEFLRRNEEFQSDLCAALEQAKYMEKSEQLEVIKSSGDLTKWGIMFRGFFAPRRIGSLVSASMFACFASNSGTAVAGWQLAVQPSRTTKPGNNPDIR